MFGEAQKYKFYVMTEFSCADLVITYDNGELRWVQFSLRQIPYYK